MKNPKRTIIILSLALAISIIAGIGVFAASNYGTSSDPLITLSYLNNTLKPDLLKQVDSEVSKAVSDLEKKIDAIGANGGVGAHTFEALNISYGQTITAEAGCEIMLREGNALCVASSRPGLIDLSDGDDLSSDSSLVSNHLYLVPESGNGLTASSDSVTVLIRGEYTID